jgi:hypothetical protein
VNNPEQSSSDRGGIDIGPWSKIAIAAAGILQAVATTWGDASNQWILFAWVTAAIVCFWELLVLIDRSTYATLKGWITAHPFKMMIGVIVSLVTVGFTTWIWRTPPIVIEARDSFGTIAVGADNRKFARILVTNNGPRDAWCRAYLLKMSKDGVLLPLPERSPLALRPGRGGDQDFPEGYLLPSHGSARPYNVATSKPESDRMIIDSLEWEHAMSDTILNAATYDLKIEISGKDCRRTTANVRIAFGGGHDLSISKK